MKLLAELNETVSFITEGEGNGTKHYIVGKLLEFDHPNRNRRIYRSEWHDPVVETYLSEKVKDGRGYGELDHPDTGTINLKNASHRIVEMHKEGSDWHGKAILMDTPMGNVAKGILASGGNLGVSSRGMGSVKGIDEGVLEVQPDFKLLTAADIVSDPSAHGAIVKGIMENVEWFWNDQLGWVAEDAKKAINKMTIKEIEDKKIAIFERFIERLKIGDHL